MFSGTIRKNLDPFDKYSDTQIWDALDVTGLREAISRLQIEKVNVENGSDSKTSKTSKTSETSPNSSVNTNKSINKSNLLEGEVEEGGGNFSTGERQLVCLARAILQRNKILIMDEATANIDLETDSKVQTAIREQFSAQGTTVVTIAHRLHTVIDCDQILVLAKGTMVESGSPHTLLSKYFGDLNGDPGPGGEESPSSAYIKNNQVSGSQPPRHSLASLVKQTGKDMCLRLRTIAKTSEKEK